jgi:hypothetical protein
MAALNRAVIGSPKVTFSDQKFEQYLQDQAADAEQVAARRAERENLLLQIPTLTAAEARLAKAIAVSDDMDALVAELKATQQERRQAEARVAELEGYEAATPSCGSRPVGSARGPHVKRWCSRR